MNSRISVSVALAAGAAMGLLFNHALPPAQAQTPAPSLMDTKIARLESRVDSLEAEVSQLKASPTILKDLNGNPFTADLNVNPSSQIQPVKLVPRQSNILPSQITLQGKSAP